MRATEWRPRAALLGAPYALVLVLFLAVPLFNLGLLSVFAHEPTAIWVPRLTLQNYRTIFADSFYVRMILDTFWIAALATVLTAVLAYPLACFLARCSPRVLPIGLFFLIMPLMVSAVVRAYGWMVMFSRSGIVNAALDAFDLPRLTALINSQPAVVGALIQFLLPVMTLPLLAAIERIPRPLEEAAANLGCHRLSVFWRVTFPLSISGLVSGTVLCFAVAASSVVIPALLGGRRGRMFGNEIYDQVITSFNWPLASAFAVFLLTLTGALIVAGMLLARQRG